MERSIFDKAQSLCVGLLSLAWIYAMTSNALSSNAPEFYAVAIFLYATSCLIALKIGKHGNPIHWLSKIPAFLASLICVFTVFAKIKLGIELMDMPASFPKNLNLAIFLILQLAISPIIAAVAFLPICSIFNRYFWVAPALSSLFAYHLEKHFLTDPSASTLSNFIMIFQLLSLGVIAPIFMALLWKWYLARAANFEFLKGPASDGAA